jgi:hypothetical protein
MLMRVASPLLVLQLRSLEGAAWQGVMKGCWELVKGLLAWGLQGLRASKGAARVAF